MPYDSWSQTGSGYKAADVKALEIFRGDALRIASVIPNGSSKTAGSVKREMPAAERCIDARTLKRGARLKAKRAIEDAKAEALEQSMRDKVTEACRIVWEQALRQGR